MNHVTGACGYIGCLLGAILLTAVGCSAETGDRLPLSGRVRFQDQPLEQGTIEFTTADRQLQTGAVISQGSFAIAAAQGLPPGEYIVRISSTGVKAAATLDTPPGLESASPPSPERIPAEFNTNSQLTITLSPEQTDFRFEIPN